FDAKPAFGEEPHGERQQDVFLLEDPCGERVFRIVLEDRDRLLQDDGPAVHGRVDEVDRTAGDLDAGSDRIAVRVGALEGGKQRGMYVDDAIRERAGEGRRDQTHD